MANKMPETGFKLPPEVLQNLRDMDKTIAEAEKGIKSLKSLKMDVSALTGQIEWAKEVQKTLLRDFGG